MCTDNEEQGYPGSFPEGSYYDHSDPSRGALGAHPHSPRNVPETPLEGHEPEEVLPRLERAGDQMGDVEETTRELPVEEGAESGRVVTFDNFAIEFYSTPDFLHLTRFMKEGVLPAGISCGRVSVSGGREVVSGDEHKMQISRFYAFGKKTLEMQASANVDIKENGREAVLRDDLAGPAVDSLAVHTQPYTLRVVSEISRVQSKPCSFECGVEIVGLEPGTETVVTEKREFTKGEQAFLSGDPETYYSSCFEEGYVPSGTDAQKVYMIGKAVLEEGRRLRDPVEKYFRLLAYAGLHQVWADGLSGDNHLARLRAFEHAGFEITGRDEVASSALMNKRLRKAREYLRGQNAFG